MSIVDVRYLDGMVASERADCFFFFLGARQRNYGVKREPVAYIAESLLPVNVL
jgi:hypothetical protein